MRNWIGNTLAGLALLASGAVAPPQNFSSYFPTPAPTTETPASPEPLSYSPRVSVTHDGFEDSQKFVTVGAHLRETPEKRTLPDAIIIANIENLRTPDGKKFRDGTYIKKGTVLYLAKNEIPLVHSYAKNDVPDLLNANSPYHIFHPESWPCLQGTASSKYFEYHQALQELSRQYTLVSSGFMDNAIINNTLENLAPLTPSKIAYVDQRKKPVEIKIVDLSHQ